ncbi:DUF4139 domain-containing protein [Terriglobus tenax]|uniref:DUF4139 domain-containing protein n=1 Tax=Terriglobus tenax TaxID=1111115 RepID=UPI0021DF72A0|nr:DUF4139 domain-containing protein [Terriglobus tenax]
MRSSTAVLFVSLVSSSLVNPANIAAQQARPAATPRVLRPSTEDRTQNLPVRRVALYKNGVGYFEHAGQVDGNQQVTIDFTTSQLNDVLQTLTAIDLNGGKIRNAGYNSTTPLEQQLKSLPLSLNENPTEADFYQAIRGARVEVTGNGAAITGRLLNVEQRELPAAEGKPQPSAQFLTVISEGGGVRTLQLTSQTQVRLLDGSLNQDVAHYLQLLSSTRNQGLRHLTLSATGTGARQLLVSYISEVPVWKSTYRFIFADSATQKQQATLQAWAIVDNTVGADWDDVQLSLIAGSPQSFIQPLSQPYYTRRPEIGLPTQAQLTPQTHQSGDMNGAAAPPPSQIGSANESVTVTAAEPMLQTESASVAALPLNGRQTARFAKGAGMGGGGGIGAGMITPELVESSVTAAASTAAYDNYFEYKLTQPVTIRKNESAMVPVLQSKLDVERVTLWSSAQPRPLRALWVTNTTGATLDSGSFSIVENGNFGGEGLFDVIHPGEKRLLSYAADDAVRVSTESNLNSRHLQKITVRKGVLTGVNREIAEITYVIHNAATSPRMVVVEHHRRAGWELDSHTQPTETTPTAYRYGVAVAPGETVRLHVGERHTLSQVWQLAQMNDQQIDMVLRTNGNDAKLRQLLEPVIAARQRVADVDQQISSRNDEMEKINDDQERLRKNLSALKSSAEERALVRRYTTELNAQEDRLATLRKETDTLKTDREKAQADFDAKLQALEVDETL